MNIGEKIKTLRKKNKITQEKLAEYLNISFQAISKWENNTAYPDIKLLPSIANFFHVTTDYLLDNEDNQDQEEMKKVLETYQRYSNKGKIEDAITLLRNTLVQYPNHYEIMTKLAQSLTTITKSTHEHKMREHAIEAIRLCQLVIEDSHDFDLIETATTTMFYAYIDLKEFEKAREIANKRPNMYQSKDVLLLHAHRGEEANEYLQSFLLKTMDLLSGYTMALTYKLYGGDRYNVDEKIEITNTAIRIIEAILNDNNYLFYANRLRRFYTFLGIYYAKKTAEKEMYNALQTAKELAISFDNRTNVANYTSILVDKQVDNPNTTVVNAEWTDFYVFQDRLNRSEFDPYRETWQFQQLLKKA